MNSKKGIEKREEIIEVTIGLAQQSDFKLMSIRNICEAANIAIGTFYYYFSSKEDLLNAILFKIDPFLTENILPKLPSESEAENL